jgi:hypothetical protein
MCNLEKRNFVARVKKVATANYRPKRLRDWSATCKWCSQPDLFDMATEDGPTAARRQNLSGHLFIDMSHLYLNIYEKKAIYRSLAKGIMYINKHIHALAAWSSGIVSAWHRGDWSYGS